MADNTLEVFRSLVSTQVAIPVAAMNTLVAKIQVCVVSLSVA